MSARKVVGPDGWIYPEGITFSDTPARRQATDANLSLWALRGQMNIERDERDPYAMTADKLARKIPGMAAGVPFIEGVGIRACRVDTHEEFLVWEGYFYREEDEELLRAEREAYLAEHPEPEPGGSSDPVDGEGA